MPDQKEQQKIKIGEPWPELDDSGHQIGLRYEVQDPNTGEVREEVVYDPEYAPAEDPDYDMHQVYDGDEDGQDHKDEGDEYGEEPNPEDSSEEAPNSSSPSTPDSEESPDSPDSPDESKSGGHDWDSMAADHMGEAGEKYNEAKQAVKDAELLARFAAGEGEVDPEAWAEAAKELPRMAKTYGLKSLKWQIAIATVLFVFICVPIVLFSMALLGYGGEGETSDYDSGGAVIDGSEITIESPPGIEGPNSKGYYFFPASSEGSYTLYGSTDPRCNHWGSKTLVDVTYTAAKNFYEKYGIKPGVGDLNSSGHITHTSGIDVDIDLQGYFIDDGSTNSQEAIDLAKLFFKTNTIRWIYYDDREVVNTVNNWATENGLNGKMKVIGGHGNHFHVRLLLDYEGPYDAPSCAGSN